VQQAVHLPGIGPKKQYGIDPHQKITNEKEAYHEDDLVVQKGAKGIEGYGADFHSVLPPPTSFRNISSSELFMGVRLTTSQPPAHNISAKARF